MRGDISRFILVLGIVLVAVGFLWPQIQKLGLGHLPGDILVEFGNFRFYFPIVTSLVISVVVTLVLWFFIR